MISWLSHRCRYCQVTGILLPILLPAVSYQYRVGQFIVSYLFILLPLFFLLFVIFFLTLWTSRPYHRVASMTCPDADGPSASIHIGGGKKTLLSWNKGLAGWQAEAVSRKPKASLVLRHDSHRQSYTLMAAGRLVVYMQ